LTFENGFNNRRIPLKLSIPVAASDRREGRLAIDGRLDDWADLDLVQDGPLVQMLDRPTLQRQEMRYAQTPAKVYTSWAGQNLYVAFELSGILPVGTGGTQNFVTYQSRRAWGEDLCELLIQPVGADNKPGPVLHVVCKPNGSNWVERKLDPRLNANPWQEVQAGVRYASRPDGSTWRGEVAIPWAAIVADTEDREDRELPPLLRFNFTQHRTATGESASWAGPVDFGRDDSFMGVLYLREPEGPAVQYPPAEEAVQVDEP
jgi:hypothetical protein